jgi:hypothetical protein
MDITSEDLGQFSNTEESAGVISRDTLRREVKSFERDESIRKFVFSDEVGVNSYSDDEISLKGVLMFDTPSLAAIKQSALERDDVKKRRKLQLEKETRASILYNEAVRYGAQVALRNTLKQFSEYVDKESFSIEKIYPFKMFMLHKDTIIPPVINLTKDGVRVTDKSFSKSDFNYKITSQARFTKRVPHFRDYLTFQDYPVRDPSVFNIPVTGNELTHWMNGIYDGWLRGERQAKIEIDNAITKLNLDILGMTRYHMLLKMKMVSEPSISRSSQGLSGDVNNIEVGVVNFVMDGVPVFELDMNNWEPLPMIDELELKKFIKRKHEDGVKKQRSR